MTLDRDAGVLVYGVATDGAPETAEIAYYSVLVETLPDSAGTVIHARAHFLAGADSSGKTLAFYDELLAQLPHGNAR